MILKFRLLTSRKIALTAASFLSLASIAAAEAPYAANPFERSAFGDDWGILRNEIFFGGANTLFGLSPATRTLLLTETTASKRPVHRSPLVSLATENENLFPLAPFGGSPFARSSGEKSAPLAPNVAPVYYFNGAFDSLWSADSSWGPEVAGYPTNAGDVATNLLVVSSNVFQDVVAGVNVGIIDHNPTTAGNSALTVSWRITTNNLIVMNNGASPAQINNSQAVGNTSLTIDGPAGLSLTSNLSITNANATGLITISAPIVGNGGITVGGIGTTVLTGDNTFYGATIVNSGTLNVGGAHSLGGGGTGLTTGLGTASVTVNTGGTLLFSGATTDRIKNDAPIILNGGTLDTAGLSEYTAGSVLPGMGALTLTSNSTIDLGAISSIIAFSDSSDETWTGTLRILNWSGNVGVGNGTDQVYFGTNALGLDSSQLNQILFFSDAEGLNFLGAATILSSGEVVPVPEPGTWIGAALALMAIAFTQRRRLRGLVPRSA